MFLGWLDLYGPCHSFSWSLLDCGRILKTETYSKVFAINHLSSLLNHFMGPLVFVTTAPQVMERDWKINFCLWTPRMDHQSGAKNELILFLAVTRNLLKHNNWSPHNFCNQDFFHVGVSLVGNLIWHSLQNEVLMNLKEAQKMPQGKEICWGDTKMSHKMMYQRGVNKPKTVPKNQTHAVWKSSKNRLIFRDCTFQQFLFLCYKRCLFSIKWDFLCNNQTLWFWLKNHFLIVGNQTKMPHIWPLLWKPSVFCSCFFGTLINYFQLLSTKKSGFHFFVDAFSNQVGCGFIS